MLEAAFELNCGNLRRAWVIFRNAMTIAQMIGLHRKKIPHLKRLEPVLDIDPEFLWFRIVYMDRYLSLLLGLSQGASEAYTEISPILQYESTMGEFERNLNVVANRILKRNEGNFDRGELSTTVSIDRELLHIAKSTPANFWRPADFQNTMPGSAENSLEVVHLTAQVYYHGLLVQLHLPYTVWRKGDGTNHEYSRITCVNAGRGILTRFIAHRTFRPRSSCSRPVDFFALLAAMMLLLARLDAYQPLGELNSMGHQRPSDLAMLEQALEKMDAVSDVGKIFLAEGSARLIRRLLAIESAVARASAYIESSASSEDEQQERNDEEHERLHLHIPYLGTLKVALHDLTIHKSSHLSPTIQKVPDARMGCSQYEEISSGPHVPFTSVPVTSSMDRPSFMSYPGAGPSTRFNEGSPMLESSPMQQHYLNDLQEDMSSNMRFPMNTIDGNDWNLQGVDVAFFESLMRGTVDGDFR